MIEAMAWVVLLAFLYALFGCSLAYLAGSRWDSPQSRMDRLLLWSGLGMACASLIFAYYVFLIGTGLLVTNTVEERLVSRAFPWMLLPTLPPLVLSIVIDRWKQSLVPKAGMPELFSQNRGRPSDVKSTIVLLLVGPLVILGIAAMLQGQRDSTKDREDVK
jgi:hypothetical protein